MSNGEAKFKLEHTEVTSQAFFSHFCLCSQSKGLSSKETETQNTPKCYKSTATQTFHYLGHIYQQQHRPEWHPSALARGHTYHMPFAGQWDKDVTAFMDQQLAVDTLVALPCEPPYPFTALATVRSLQATMHIISPRIIPCWKGAVL